MIKPTPGRIVWYRPRQGDTRANGDDAPLAAIVCGVHSDTCVNLAVFDFNGGGPYPRTSVTLVQDEDQRNVAPGECGWMPYQKGQAAKAEQLERQLTERADVTRDETTQALASGASARASGASSY